MSKKEPEGIATEHRVMGDQTTLVVGALLLTEKRFLAPKRGVGKRAFSRSGQKLEPILQRDRQDWLTITDEVCPLCRQRALSS